MSSAAARRLALGAQGFAASRPTGRIDVRHLRRAVEQMAVLQLDSVNVVCRSHYLPVLARLGPYDRRRLDDWCWRSGEAFEYIAHEASISPVRRHPLLRFRMATGRWRAGRRLERDRPEWVASVRAEVAERGPLSVRELSDPGGRGGSWWGWSPGKIALEWLYVTGRLAIAERTSAFITRYDLPERVIPPDVLDAPTPEPDEAVRQLVVTAARAAGVGTAGDLADWFRLPVRQVRATLGDLVATGQLHEVRVDGWDEPAVVHPDARVPRRIDTRALLSPFDPVVWNRDRAERLFGFRYRIEIYVPAARRVHGYYVLPLLVGDRLVGRFDLKADRAERVLRVRAAHVEPGADHAEAAEAAADALDELAGFLGLGGVVVDGPGQLGPALTRAVVRR